MKAVTLASGGDRRHTETAAHKLRLATGLGRSPPPAPVGGSDVTGVAALSASPELRPSAFCVWPPSGLRMISAPSRGPSALSTAGSGVA
jgi:hypothetical protein